MQTGATQNNQNKIPRPASGFLTPDLTFSVCAAADIKTWKRTSYGLLDCVPSNSYAVIVPDEDVLLFKIVTDKKINVIPESVYIGDLKTLLCKKTTNSSRIGWYLQQFIKLAVLKEARQHENYLIWDADTVPIKELRFFSASGAVEFYTGTECHDEYFNVIRSLLNLEKIAPFSFIAQCFPCKGLWAKSFYMAIEERHQCNYLDAIIGNINFSATSGFSEYETLGTFVYKNFKEHVSIKSSNWLRNGAALIGGVQNIDRYPYNALLKNFDHITFEKWERPFSLLKQPNNEEFSNYFLSLEASSKPNLEGVLDDLFDRNLVRTIVQFGANDGVHNDPLRKYLSEGGGYEAYLVEPLPYYVEKLRELYASRGDIHILQKAAGSTDQNREFYFIPPAVASEMNGDGPSNDWAHGQGSFLKETIVHWIEKNDFRGEIYRAKIPEFIDSIRSIGVQICRADCFLPRHRNGCLVVIDVQGFEFEVLNGIDWSNPPEWILVEDDLNLTYDLLSFLLEKGFLWISGGKDKLFGRG